jgi:hypothetical protein
MVDVVHVHLALRIAHRAGLLVAQPYFRSDFPERPRCVRLPPRRSQTVHEAGVRLAGHFPGVRPIRAGLAAELHRARALLLAMPRLRRRILERHRALRARHPRACRPSLRLVPLPLRRQTRSRAKRALRGAPANVPRGRVSALLARQMRVAVGFRVLPIRPAFVRAKELRVASPYVLRHLERRALQRRLALRTRGRHRRQVDPLGRIHAR